MVSWDPSEPENAERLEAFRAYHGLDEAIGLIGGYSGSLSSTGEVLTLWRPLTSGAMRLEDQAAYGDASMPPAGPPAPGEALHRFGNEGVGLYAESWVLGAPTPGSGP